MYCLSIDCVLKHMLRITILSAPTGKDHTLDLLSQGIIYNDTPPDSHIVGWSGYQKQSISSKWLLKAFVYDL